MPKLLGLEAAVWATLPFMTQIGPASAKANVDFPLTKIVGPLRAGQLCFPNGSLRGTDFVTDEGQFDLLVRQVLNEQLLLGQSSLETNSVPKIEIHLKSAAVKLCAKSWGMFGTGDTKSFSGEASFTFDWKNDSHMALVTETIALDIKGKERLTAPAILRRAVAVLLGRMAESEQ